MPIEDRNLEPGTRLVARHKKQDRTCEVVTADGGLRYRLDDGTEHKSPSAAGKAVVGHACNGWVFWSVEGTEKPKRERKAKKEPKAKRPAPRPTRDPFDVLGMSREASFDEVSASYRRLAKRLHPDAGGSHAAMVDLNAAYETIRTSKPKAEKQPKPKADKPATEPAAKKPAKAKAASKSGAKKGKAVRAAANGESYGCGVCPETFPSLEDAQAHVASVHAEP